MTRDRLIRTGIGLVVGAGLGWITYRTMSPMDMDWSFGTSTPLIAGGILGVAVFLLFAITNGKKLS